MNLTKEIINLPDTAIGEYTYGTPTIIRSYAGCKLEIGKFCSIGINVTIAFFGEHSMVDITTYPFEYLSGWPIVKGTPINGEDIYIGNDVWIANNVLIMQGAYIEDGAVIGANSVVAGHVDSYTLVAGNPAKEIKKRFTKSDIDFLLEMKWWDWPIEKIKQHLSVICSPNIYKLYEIWSNEIRGYSSKRSIINRICPVCDVSNLNFSPLPFEYFQQLNRVQAAYSLEDFETLNLNEYLCPVCQSSDRERLYALYFKKLIEKRSEDKPLRVLDVAPSPALSRFIKKQNVIYRSADLLSPLADDRIDITDMSCYLDKSFDFLICSHVLEHIPDDAAAIRELFRVLSPGGEAIIMVPILLTANVTDEDPNETRETERWRRFGQNDHVRMYCKQDFADRLEKGGFEVKKLGVEFFGEEIFYSHGISAQSVLYIGQKPYRSYDFIKENAMNHHSENYTNTLELENKKLKEELKLKNALLAFKNDFFMS